MPWTRDDAEHLLRRAGFGGSLDDVDRLFALGQAGAIDALVNYERIPDPIWANNSQFSVDRSIDDWGPRMNVLIQFINSQRPLQAKMLWFWHSHFTTSFQAFPPPIFWQTLSLYRDNALGNFGTLLSGMYKDPGMLMYLNGNCSQKAGPNENFGRECLELFTMGVGTYTEADVKACAQAFSGWSVPFIENATSVIDWNQWDPNPKTILGETANFTSEQLIAKLAARPETRQRMTGKLYRYFVNNQLNVTDQASMVTTWASTNGNLRTVVSSMLATPPFWDPKNRWTIIKTPMDLVLELLNRFEIVPDRSMMVEVLMSIIGMGYMVFDPPNVAGYRSTDLLVGTSSLLARYKFSSKVINTWASDATMARFSAGLVGPVAPAALIATVVSTMGSMPLAANTLGVLNGYLGTAPIADADLLQRTRDVAFLVACCAEYQLM